MGNTYSKPTPLETMLKIFKKGFSRNYRVVLTPEKLKTLCEVDWPAFGVDWPSEGTLNKSLVSKIRQEVICGELEHLDQFPYLRGQAVTVLVAKGQTARKEKNPQRDVDFQGLGRFVAETRTPKVLEVLAAEEFLPIMPPPPQGLPAPRLEASAPLPELHTPKPPRVDKREWEKLLPLLPAPWEKIPLWQPVCDPRQGEQKYTGVDENGDMVERHVFTYLPFTLADLINWKNNNPSYTKKPQALIDLLQTIIQTHNPTWVDCHQLLMCLFNTDERLCEAFRMYTPFDPESPENQHVINITLVIQCAEDIRRKLQKQAGFVGMNTSQLLKIANQVFVNREAVSCSESHRENERQAQQNADLIAAAIKGMPPRGQGKGDSWEATQSACLHLQRDQCAYCREVGHWKEKCPQLA
ncbi:Gag polyprotein [Plecturocebus cupreus]